MTTGPSKPQIVDALDDARRRTLGLLDPIPAADQLRQVSELMSPLCWDLAHIGHYEELWLVRTLSGAEPTDPAFDDIYDAFKHPRRDRVSLPILDPQGARRLRRRRARPHAPRARRVGARRAVTRSSPAGFVYGMVVQHEHQHDETLLATIQLMDDFAHPDADGDARADEQAVDEHVHGDLAPDVLIPGGNFVIGTSDDPWAYDNERPEHEVTVAPFRIDTTPVTNRAYREFVEAGGYDDPRLWDDGGLGVASGSGTRRAAVLASGGRRRVDASALRAHRGPPARRARAARVLVRGRCVRPLGGRAPADGSRNGRSPPRARRSSTPTSGTPGRTASRRPT